jgi:hypothetical protein
MRPLSALDAISPAWNHTRDLLLRPRSLGLLLKIGCVAALAGMSSANLSSNNHMGTPMHGAHRVIPPTMIAAIVAGVVLVAVVLVLIWLAIFYIGSRMQFVLFEVVLQRDTRIAPIWRRYGPATWRWIGLKLLFALVCLLVMAPLIAPMAVHMMHTLPHLNTHNPQEFLTFVAGITGFGVAALVIGLVLGAAYRLLVSFGIPSMALEGTSLRETVRRIFALAQAEPGPVFLFLLLHLVLAIAGGIACYIAIGLAAFVGLIPLGGIGVALWAGLHHSGLGGHVVMIAGIVVVSLVLVALLVCVGLVLVGYLSSFLQAYALYFLGGRYPMLGAYLEPLLPPPPQYFAAPGYAVPPTP